MHNYQSPQSHCSLEQPAPCHLIWNGPCHTIPIFRILNTQPERHMGSGIHRSDRNFIKIWRTPVNIRIDVLSPETRYHAEHFCCWQYGCIFISFYAIVFEIHTKKSACNVMSPSSQRQSAIHMMMWSARPQTKLNDKWIQIKTTEMVAGNAHINARLDQCRCHLHHQFIKIWMEAVQTAVNCHRHLRLADAIHKNCNTCATNKKLYD